MTMCGKTILFGNKPVMQSLKYALKKLKIANKLQVQWADNWNICCSLGMKPLTIENLDEQKCWDKATGVYRELKYGELAIKKCFKWMNLF